MYWIYCNRFAASEYEHVYTLWRMICLVPSLSRVRTLHKDCQRRKLREAAKPRNSNRCEIPASEGIVVGTDGPALFIDQAVVQAGLSQPVGMEWNFVQSDILKSLQDEDFRGFHPYPWRISHISMTWYPAACCSTCGSCGSGRTCCVELRGHRLASARPLCALSETLVR